MFWLQNSWLVQCTGTVPLKLICQEVSPPFFAWKEQLLLLTEQN